MGNTSTRSTSAGDPGLRRARIARVERLLDRPAVDLYEKICRAKRPKTPTEALRLREAARGVVNALIIEHSAAESRYRGCRNPPPGSGEKVRAAADALAVALGVPGVVQEDPVWTGCYWMIPFTSTHGVWVDWPTVGDVIVVEEIQTRFKREAAEREQFGGLKDVARATSIYNDWLAAWRAR
jgi:hypothetical protein